MPKVLTCTFLFCSLFVGGLAQAVPVLDPCVAALMNPALETLKRQGYIYIDYKTGGFSDELKDRLLRKFKGRRNPRFIREDFVSSAQDTLEGEVINGGILEYLESDKDLHDFIPVAKDLIEGGYSLAPAGYESVPSGFVIFIISKGQKASATGGFHRDRAGLIGFATVADEGYGLTTRHIQAEDIVPLSALPKDESGYTYLETNGREWVKQENIKFAPRDKLFYFYGVEGKPYYGADSAEAIWHAGPVPLNVEHPAARIGMAVSFAFVKETLPLQIDDNFNARDRRLIQEVGQKIRQFSAGLIFPETLVEKSDTPFTKSKYLPGRDILRFNFSDYKYNRRSATTVLAHEYGHALFDNNLKFQLLGRNQTIPDAVKSLLEQEAAIRRLPGYLDIESKVEALNRKFGSFTADEANLKKKLEEERDLYFLNNGGSQTREFYREIVNDSRLLLPYNELFADMIAVMLMRNGQAVSRLFTRHTPYGEEENTTRDFTHEVRVERFSIPDEGLFNLSNRDPREYEELNPSRFHIWQHYLKDLNPAKFPQILRAYLNAVCLQAVWYFEKDDLVDNLNLELVNRQFIQFLDAEMKKPL